jgi:hypothetical protein
VSVYTGCSFIIRHLKICITSLLLNVILCIFHRSFYKLGNLFSAIGNPELSNKMALYMTDHKTFITKMLYSSGGSYVAVVTQGDLVVIVLSVGPKVCGFKHS